MAPRVIKFDPLDVSSVLWAISESQRFHDDFMKTCDKVLESVSLQGSINARKEVAAYGAVYTGNLQRSILNHKPQSGSRVWEVRASAEYAGFVEYGTGIKGADYSHPEAGLAGWVYDINGHGQDGWDYKNKRDGKYYHTTGYRARPFMFNTVMYLTTQAEPITDLWFHGF